MNIIYAEYNTHHNSIDIYAYGEYVLWINCEKVKKGLKTTHDSECALNALAIGNTLEYA